MTFLLKVDETAIEAPYTEALRKEIVLSKLTKQPGNDELVDGKYSTYKGYSDHITQGLDYLLDELLPLESFVCLAVYGSQLDIRGKAYVNTFFNPTTVFNNGTWTITKPLIVQFNNQL